MLTAKIRLHKLNEYVDLKYLLKFFLLITAFYYFNIIFFSLTTPYGNYYFPFLEQHLNYIAWLRSAILFLSNEISRLIGIQSFVPNSFTLASVGGTRLIVGEPCLGLGVLSFWAGFVIADDSSFRRKLRWCFGGFLIIYLINCARVAFMLKAFEENWTFVTKSDYHTAFNVFAYAFVFLLIFLYNRSGRMEKLNRNADDSPASPFQ